MEIHRIEKIANETRKEFEENKIPLLLLKKLYYEYNSIFDVDSFVKKSRDLFPKLNCGIASVYLQSKIPGAKIVRGKYANENHTFLVIEEKILVDITSDQYGGPRVYVGPIQNPWCLR